MAVHDPHDLPDVDREIRINDLKEQARELSDGEMFEWESDETPPDVSEQFWQNVVAWETAPDTSHWEQLRQDGVDLPPTDALDDDRLHTALWELIHALARRRVFLSQTDHLSDRELYRLLTEDVLHEITKDIPPDAGWNCHLDILGGCSEEDIYLHHKYYADEEERARWAQDWPDDEMPDHVDPPYDRDRLLPQRHEPAEFDDEDDVE